MDSQPSLLDLLNPTRKHMLLLLKERGTATAQELAEACYLSTAAARLHLTELERQHLVEHSPRREGPGRPAHVYRLSESGEALFPQCYAPLLEEILAVVGSAPQYSERLWAAIEKRQAVQVNRIVGSGTPRERMSRMLDLAFFREFHPLVEAKAEGEWTITMRHCPLVTAARKDSRICQAEHNIMRRVLGPELELTVESTRTCGGPVCGYRVSRAAARNRPAEMALTA